MKKTARLILLLLAFVTAFMLSACGKTEKDDNDPPKKSSHTHDYGDWELYGSDKERRYCSCGDFEERDYVAPHTHDYGDWELYGTDKERRYCSCGDFKERDYVAPHTHDYGDWELYGTDKERRYCSCGDFEERDYIAPHTHDMGEWGNNTATCVSAGKETRKCKTCDYTEERATEALDHDLGDWTTSGDKKRRDCSRCDYFEEKTNTDYVEIANKVFAFFGTAPDVWSFLPESFAFENRKADSVITYEEFVSLSDIPDCGMGKQLNVMYGLLSKFGAASKYVNVVYGSLGSVKALYTAFLDSEPENDKVFSGETENFAFTLTLTENEYTLAVSFKDSTGLTLYGRTGDASYGASIIIADRGAFRFEVAEATLTIAASVQTSADNADNSITAQLSFTRDDNGKVSGMLYEHISALGYELMSASAMIEIGEKYTTVIGTKGDFTAGFDGRNCEVYDNATGKLIATEVKEASKLVTYDTYWFPIYQLTGIESIKKVDEKSSLTAMNPDTVYINGLDGEDNILATKKVLTSRKFDIEFKTMYFYVLNEETGEYEEETMEIPMLFIQAEHYGTFESDFNDANEHLLNGTAELLVTDTQKDVISDAYATLLPEYDELKDAVSKEDIIDFCKG